MCSRAPLLFARPCPALQLLGRFPGWSVGDAVSVARACVVGSGRAAPMGSTVRAVLGMPTGTTPRQAELIAGMVLDLGQRRKTSGSGGR